jgi:AcrR family transcriptional regulator
MLITPLYNGVIPAKRGGVALNQELSTLEKIMEVSKREFLQKGFKDASLRNIAAAAGLTTGAIYGYFKDKNAIFEALVAPVCRQVDEIFASYAQTYYQADGFVSDISIEKSMEQLRHIYRFVYDHFDVFRLLLVCSEGSSRSSFAHMLVEYETMHTMAYLEQLKAARNLDFSIDEEIIHILSDSYISALMEPVRHNMSYDAALKSVEILGVFFAGGWKTVMESLLGVTVGG